MTTNKEALPDSLELGGASFVLVKAKAKDIPKLIDIEKSVDGSRVYSPMLEEDEWEEELKNCTVYLIQKGTEVLGSLTCELKNDNELYIGGLAIDSRYQSKGVGFLVMQEIVKKFSYFERVTLVCHPENVRALTMYKALGFIEESRKEDYYGDGEPRLIMVLQK